MDITGALDALKAHADRKANSAYKGGKGLAYLDWHPTERKAVSRFNIIKYLTRYSAHKGDKANNPDDLLKLAHHALLEWQAATAGDVELTPEPNQDTAIIQGVCVSDFGTTMHVVCKIDGTSPAMLTAHMRDRSYTRATAQTGFDVSLFGKNLRRDTETAWILDDCLLVDDNEETATPEPGPQHTIHGTCIIDMGRTIRIRCEIDGKPATLEATVMGRYWKHEDRIDGLPVSVCGYNLRYDGGQRMWRLDDCELADVDLEPQLSDAPAHEPDYSNTDVESIHTIEGTWANEGDGLGLVRFDDGEGHSALYVIMSCSGFPLSPIKDEAKVRVSGRVSHFRERGPSSLYSEYYLDDCTVTVLDNA